MNIALLDLAAVQAPLPEQVSVQSAAGSQVCVAYSHASPPAQSQLLPSSHSSGAPELEASELRAELESQRRAHDHEVDGLKAALETERKAHRLAREALAWHGIAYESMPL